MKKSLFNILTSIIIITPFSAVMAENPVVDKLMESYQAQGATKGNIQNGQQFWNKTFSGKAPFTERSCKACHTANLKNSGKHVRTGKILKPLAPSSNPESLTSEQKIKKWLTRNCKWTKGEECSVQEKSDILAFIKQQ
jgi:hypothetical protein